MPAAEHVGAAVGGGVVLGAEVVAGGVLGAEVVAGGVVAGGVVAGAFVSVSSPQAPDSRTSTSAATTREGRCMVSSNPHTGGDATPTAVSSG
jgi:hypothetical protein